MGNKLKAYRNISQIENIRLLLSCLQNRFPAAAKTKELFAKKAISRPKVGAGLDMKGRPFWEFLIAGPVRGFENDLQNRAFTQHVPDTQFLITHTFCNLIFGH